ncbi:hypothetical protein B6S09_09230 [Oceanimonas baumannii]|uniref:DUF3630 domain-containing protein n=2 Tax=Oceanimonas baumannii TaxID=129578 RepID=A0A235CK68_9GAMM|nr:hypothetical protein B6S09_09230 [Oceanimonas baumannii]
MIMIPLKSAVSITIETFPGWAEEVARQLELTVLERESGADYHQWLVNFEGSRLFLCFQHYADCAWLEALSAGDEGVAVWLTGQWNQG